MLDIQVFHFELGWAVIQTRMSKKPAFLYFNFCDGMEILVGGGVNSTGKITNNVLEHLSDSKSN